MVQENYLCQNNYLFVNDLLLIGCAYKKKKDVLRVFFLAFVYSLTCASWILINKIVFLIILTPISFSFF